MLYKFKITKFLNPFKKKTPGDGFEPPLKEPESFVLPLDDPGIICKLHFDSTTNSE